MSQGPMVLFFWKRRVNSRLEQRTQAKTQAKLPSKACEPEFRPSEPSSSAAEKPSPVVT